VRAHRRKHDISDARRQFRGPGDRERTGRLSGGCRNAREQHRLGDRYVFGSRPEVDDEALAVFKSTEVLLARI